MKGEKKQNGGEDARSGVCTVPSMHCKETWHEERVSCAARREAREVMSPPHKSWWQLLSCIDLAVTAGSLRTEAHNGKQKSLAASN